MLSYKKENIEESDISFPSWPISTGIRGILDKMTSQKFVEEKVTLLTLEFFKEEFTGVILLVGEPMIVFSVGMSMNSGKNLLMAMTGLPREKQSNQDLVDGVSEIANVVGGDIKARLSAKGTLYTVPLPFTIEGSGHRLIHKSKSPLFIRKYNSEGIEILVQGYSVDVY